MTEETYHDEVYYLGRVDQRSMKTANRGVSPHGKLKWLVHPADETGKIKFGRIFTRFRRAAARANTCTSREEQILVWKATDRQSDGARWQWEAGDFICVPRMTTPQILIPADQSRSLLCAMPNPYVDVGPAPSSTSLDAAEYAAGEMEV